MNPLTESEKRRRCIALTAIILIGANALIFIIPYSVPEEGTPVYFADNLYSPSTFILFLFIGLVVLIANIVLWRNLSKNEKTNAS